MKYICLQIDYRNKTVSWWDWTKEDKEITEFNLTSGIALYSNHKIKNNFFEIYKTLLTDLGAAKDVVKDVSNHTITYGTKFTMMLDEKMILVRSDFMDNEYKVYKPNRKEGELELL